MNVILEEKEIVGLWVIKVQVSSGQLICVNHKGTLAEAREKAMMAEPEPA